MAMRTTRSNRRLLCWGTGAAVALMLGAALSAPEARADETNYINDLNNAGIIIWNIPGVISDGYRVCAEAQRGWTWTMAAAQLMADNPRLNYSDAITEARIAKMDLC